MSSRVKASEKHVIHDVVHYRQRYNWDCGVSCVLMLLPPHQREYFLENFSQICEEEGFQQSTWTIDLCYLLKRFGIKHHMYTTMLGVNEAYKKQGYYTRIIDLDRDRVQRRFQQASSNQIPVTEECVSIQKMVAHLRRRGPLVLLVDGGLLVCDLLFRRRVQGSLHPGGRLHADESVVPRPGAGRPRVRRLVCLAPARPRRQRHRPRLCLRLYCPRP